jgi:hypothetical protein
MIASVWHWISTLSLSREREKKITMFNCRHLQSHVTAALEIWQEAVGYQQARIYRVKIGDEISRIRKLIHKETAQQSQATPLSVDRAAHFLMRFAFCGYGKG